MPVEDLPQATREALTYAQDIMGFAPNDVLTMAHWPELLEAMERLVQTIYKPGALDPVLKRLIATITSGAAGCRYCQAHTAHGAVEMAGADQEKVAKVWEYSTDPSFSDAERAALELALAAGTQPNAATDDHFRELEKHFSKQEIMEIMGVIGLFGFLNRWNDTLATEIEDKPLNFASKTYSNDVWEPGRHQRG